MVQARGIPDSHGRQGEQDVHPGCTGRCVRAANVVGFDRYTRFRFRNASVATGTFTAHVAATYQMPCTQSASPKRQRRARYACCMCTRCTANSVIDRITTSKQNAAQRKYARPCEGKGERTVDVESAEEVVV